MSAILLIYTDTIHYDVLFKGQQYIEQLITNYKDALLS